MIKVLVSLLVSFLFCCNILAQGPICKILVYNHEDVIGGDPCGHAHGFFAYKDTSTEHMGGYLGYMITPAHVLTDIIDFKVCYDDEQESINNKVVYFNCLKDLAIVRVWMPKNTEILKIADAIKVGENIVFISDRDIQSGRILNFSNNYNAFSDIKIRRGDSGRPVTNDDGEVVGIILAGLPHMITKDNFQFFGLTSRDFSDGDLWPCNLLSCVEIKNVFSFVVNNPLPIPLNEKK